MSWTARKLESLLRDHQFSFTYRRDDLWTMEAKGLDGRVYLEVNEAQQKYMFSIKLMDIPQIDRELFYEKLLRLNGINNLGSFAIRHTDILDHLNVCFIQIFQQKELDYQCFISDLKNFVFHGQKAKIDCFRILLDCT